ncbi:MAG: hypothetical protein M2R46_01249 [Verrucomicrobia subdivision 3 bacterium]|nr:hypothetical protein [Limisphaerales bacterium]
MEHETGGLLAYTCASNTLGGRCLKWVDIFISSMTVTLSAASLFPVLYAGGLCSCHVRSSSKFKTARQTMYIIPFFLNRLLGGIGP